MQQRSSLLHRLTRALRGATHCRARQRRRQRSDGSESLESRHLLTAIVPTIVLTDISIPEGSTTATNAILTLQLDGVTDVPVTVNFTTREASARANVDFTAVFGTVTIPAGELTAQLAIPITNDLIHEADEAFEVVFSEPVNAGLSRASAVVTIVDDDPLPVLTVADNSLTEGNSGTSRLTLTARLNGPSLSPVTFAWQTRDGSARAGSDYRAASGTATIPAGQTMTTFSVLVNGDQIYEPDESFDVVITSLIGATASAEKATITILNNDAPSSVRVADVKVTEGLEAQVRISLNKVSSFPVTVQYTTIGQTAAAGLDFVTTNGTATIPAGAFSVVVSIPTIDDTVDEADKKFLLNITSVENASITDGSASITVVDNDPPVIAVSDVTVTETDSGIVRTFLTLRTSSKSPVPMTVEYRTRDLSATGGEDFPGASGVIVIPAGSQFGRIEVDVTGDRLDELNEVFEVELHSPVGASLSKSVGRILIVDNDAPPVVSIENTSVDESAGDSGFTLISLSTVSGRPVTVEVRAQSITTQPSQDFVAIPQTVTIPTGQLSARVPFSILEDSLDEPNEAFRLILESPDGAVIGKTAGIVTIEDNDGSQLPLFELTDLAYVGAFQVPTGRFGSASFEFGGNAITWNPLSNSLFMASNINSGLNIAEISVPTELTAGGVVSQMATATVLQPFVNLGSHLRTNAAGRTSRPAIGYENLNLGGLLVTANGLTGGMYMGYNGAEPQNSTHSHFRSTTLNLASIDATNFTGLVDIRTSPASESGRIRGGYMAEVPPQWRAWIGADFVTGAAAQNRIQFSSSGPALFGFDAANPRSSSGNALLAYPFGRALQWSETSGTPLPLFNGTTSIDGVAFVPGTRSVIFVGSNGLSAIGYGTGAQFNDTARPYSGFHSQDGNYQYQIWAYDIDDFVSVRNGTKASWEIRPTSVVNFELPTPEPSKYLGGTAFDPATGRLFISQKNAGPNSTPVIHVYQLGRASEASTQTTAGADPQGLRSSSAASLFSRPIASMRDSLRDDLFADFTVG